MTMEMPGIEPGAFHMQSERATTALHPLTKFKPSIAVDISNQKLDTMSVIMSPLMNVFTLQEYVFQI